MTCAIFNSLHRFQISTMNLGFQLNQWLWQKTIQFSYPKQGICMPVEKLSVADLGYEENEVEHVSSPRLIVENLETKQGIFQI